MNIGMMDIYEKKGKLNKPHGLHHPYS